MAEQARTAVAAGRRVQRAVLALLAGLLVLLAAEGALRWRQARRPLPTGAAEWIWIDGPPRHTAPRAFWAVRDFQLAEPLPRASVLVAADEKYVLFVNGKRVGSACFREDAPLDRYPVARYLRSGSNRIAVELRSSRGAGGLLLALVDGEGRPRVVSDESFRTFRREHPGVLGGWLPVHRGEPAVSWGRPPRGRWGRPRRAVDRPAFETVAGAAWGRTVRPPRWVRVGPRGSRFHPLEPLTETSTPLGPEVTFDWGEEVTGYLVLVQSRQRAQAVGLLYTGATPPRPHLGLAEATVVTVPGSVLWRDASPRRFRYATVLGLSGLVGAWVEPVPAPRMAELPPPPKRPSPGVFGVPAPLLRTPIEDEVRRKLKSFAGGALGEDL